MKLILTSLFLCCMLVVRAQTNLPAPIEERQPMNYWWWVVGVVIVLAAGIGLYMWLKKDPRRDAV